ncbi:hypothetical protein SK128_014336, partial [Halocaridina rubra]
KEQYERRLKDKDEIVKKLQKELEAQVMEAKERQIKHDEFVENLQNEWAAREKETSYNIKDLRYELAKVAQEKEEQRVDFLNIKCELENKARNLQDDLEACRQQLQETQCENKRLAERQKYCENVAESFVIKVNVKEKELRERQLEHDRIVEELRNELDAREKKAKAFNMNLMEELSAKEEEVKEHMVCRRVSEKRLEAKLDEINILRNELAKKTTENEEQRGNFLSLYANSRTSQKALQDDLEACRQQLQDAQRDIRRLAERQHHLENVAESFVIKVNVKEKEMRKRQLEHGRVVEELRNVLVAKEKEVKDQKDCNRVSEK